MAQKTYKVLGLCNNGKSFIVIKHIGEVNPYWLYERFWEQNQEGYLTKRRTLVQKYADLASCLHCIIGKAYDGGEYADCMYAV